MNLFIWLPVVAGFGTLKEVENEWTLIDIMDAFEALDIKSQLESQAFEV